MAELATTAEVLTTRGEGRTHTQRLLINGEEFPYFTVGEVKVEPAGTHKFNTVTLTIAVSGPVVVQDDQTTGRDTTVRVSINPPRLR